MAEFLVLFGLDRTPFTTRAFRLIDDDRSGELDFFEFIAAVWNYCTMDWETLVRYSFDLFDTDNSGQLEMEEIERLVCYVAGTKKPDSRAKKVLKLMDHVSLYNSTPSFIYNLEPTLFPPSPPPHRTTTASYPTTNSSATTGSSNRFSSPRSKCK